MNNRIDLTECKSYASEANLMKALAKLGLDNYAMSDTDMPCRYIVARTPDGRWTAIFMVSEFMRNQGGYIGFAAQHGFTSV